MTMVYKNWRMRSIKAEHILQFLFDKKELGRELSFPIPNLELLQRSCEDKRTDNPIRENTTEVT